LIPIQIVKYRRERVPPPKVLGRCGITTVHEHEEIRVLGEKCHLTGSVASIGAVSVGVDQFTDRQPVSHLCLRQIGVIIA
jgi:hypothetical protein